MWKNQILARAIRIQKKIGGSQAFFRDELNFGKKLPCILCISTLFENYGCLIIPEKCMVTQ